MITGPSRVFSVPTRWLARSRDEHSWRWRSRHPDVFRVRDMVGDEPCLWLIPIRVCRVDGPSDGTLQAAARYLAIALQRRARKRRASVAKGHLTDRALKAWLSGIRRTVYGPSRPRCCVRCDRTRRAITCAVDHLASAIEAADQPDHSTVDGCLRSIARVGEMVVIAEAQAALEASVVARHRLAAS